MQSLASEIEFNFFKLLLLIEIWFREFQLRTSKPFWNDFLCVSAHKFFHILKMF